jgi:hypothetical protein
MRHWAVVLALALVALAGCFPEDTWSSRVEEEEYQPDPPEHLLRQPADFKLYDPHVRKEFFLYFYQDESVSQEIVTVINYALPEPDRRPRLATREEHDYAIAIFMEDWKARNQNEKIRYFNERYSQEVARSNTLIDEKIVYKEQEIRSLEDKRISLQADIKSREMTGAYQAGDEKFKLVETSVAQRELAKTERMLLLSKGQLLILQYLRDQRNSQYARTAVLLVENTMSVKDLLEAYGAPERFIAEVKQATPFAWERPGATIEIDGTDLVVKQTRDVILKVRDFVERLRTDMAARKKAAAPQ